MLATTNRERSHSHKLGTTDDLDREVQVSRLTAILSKLSPLDICRPLLREMAYRSRGHWPVKPADDRQAMERALRHPLQTASTVLA